MSGADRIRAVTERRGGDKKMTLRNALEAESVLGFIRAVAPGLDAKGVAMVAFAHVQSTPALQKCSVKSVVTAVVEAAKLGLTVDGVLGHAYLVPYGGQAKMLIGYRGIAHLAYQSGKITRIHADNIHAADSYHYAEGVEVEFRHRRAPLGEDRGDMIGVYAIAHQVEGPPLVVVMDMEEVHRRRARSASYKGNKATSPWTTDFAPMARKCPIRELGKLIPYPTLQGAALRDEARDEGRPDEPSVLDLGDAELVPDEPPAAVAGTCPECGVLPGLEHGENCSRPDPVALAEGGTGSSAGTAN